MKKRKSKAQKGTPPPRTEPHTPTRARQPEIPPVTPVVTPAVTPVAKPDPRNLSKADRQTLFLEHYASIGNIGETAKQTGIGRRTHYEWMDEPASEYSKRFQEAEEAFRDLVRETVRQKAVLGWTQPLMDRYGNLVGYQEKFSERLLEKLAEAKCPEFKRKTEISGPEGAPLKIEVVTGVPQPEGK